MQSLSPFGKKILTLLAGGALVAIATYLLPAEFTDQQEELRLLGVALMGWAFRAPGDGTKGGPPPGLMGLVLVLGLTAGCGGAQRAGVAVPECAKPAPLELVLQIRDELLNDGGPASMTISERLWHAVAALGQHYGLRAIQCAAQEAGEMLRDHNLEILRANGVKGEGEAAVMARHADLMRRLAE